MKRIRLLAAALSLALVANTGAASFAPKAQAAPVTGFHAGNIMSDLVFTDFRSMSVNDIQRFLDAKGAGCSGSLCLKNYTQGGKTAARIMYDASQTYRINPKVFIVLVQKEVGLVTDTSPQSWQYRTATGYGCPDTAACDSKYYGFTNQIKWSGTMFRAIMNNSSTWYTPYTLGSNRVYYHPDLSRCGYKTINLENRTTVALYSYTPYQPNKAALDAGYGLGNSCSSYGNRNFYQYYKDWFGSPYVSQVFRTTSSNQVYLLSGTKYFRVPGPSVLAAYGFTDNDISVVSSSTLSLLQDGGTLKTIARFGGNEIYIVDNGRKIRFPGPSMYGLYGYTMGQESNLDQSVQTTLPSGGTVSEIINNSNGGTKYLVESQRKRHITGSTPYTTLGNPIYSSRPVVNLSSSYVSTVISGAPVVGANAFLKDSSKNSIGFWNGTSLLAIDPAIFNELGLPVNYTSDTVSLLPTTPNVIVKKLVKTPSEKYYLLDTNQIFEPSIAQRSALGLDNGEFISISEGLGAALATKKKSFQPVARINGSDEIYLLNSSERYHITSSSALGEYGYTTSQVVNINTKSSALFPLSSKKIYASGTLLRINSSSAIYLINTTSTRLHIPSMNYMNAFGYSLDEVHNLSNGEVALYGNTGSLAYIVKTSDSTVWLIDSNGIKRVIPLNLRGAGYYNLNLASLPLLSDFALKRFTTRNSITPILQAKGQSRVYKIEGGQKRWVRGMTALTRAGYTTSDIRYVSPSVMETFPIGPAL